MSCCCFLLPTTNQYYGFRLGYWCYSQLLSVKEDLNVFFYTKICKTTDNTLYCKVIYTNFIIGYFHLTLKNVASYTMENINIFNTIVNIITGLILIPLLRIYV